MSPAACAHENVDALDGAVWCEDCGADLDPFDDTCDQCGADLDPIDDTCDQCADDLESEASLFLESIVEGVAVERARRESPEGRAERDAARDFLRWW